MTAQVARGSSGPRRMPGGSRNAADCQGKGGRDVWNMGAHGHQLHHAGHVLHPTGESPVYLTA